MKIWLINHYAVPPQYYPLARPSLFAKNLIRMGHDVTIIAASTVHNSDENLISGNERIRQFIDDGIPYVLIKCSDYRGNGVRRTINILEFAKKLPGVLDSLEKPDAIVATSFDPLSCRAGIKYAKKHGVKAIAEIADLWPETLVAYTGIGRNNPVVRYLRRVEKEIFLLSDAIVFTMEGAYDYIVEQGWESEIPREKVHYINNGVDLEAFDYNKEHFQIHDEDLNDPETFKVVYAGSIRKVNDLGLLLDAAKMIDAPNVKILIWGDGDERKALERRVQEEHIDNVIFKGRVEKKYIPYIVSQADMNIAHNSASPLFRFGISFNKLFDYLAAGKPILSDFPSGKNPADLAGGGLTVDSQAPEAVAEGIKVIARMEPEKYSKMCINARQAAEQYDFSNLTGKLISVIKGE